MARPLLTLSILLLFLSNLSSQERLLEISATFFRPDPFRSEFNVFVQRMMNDPLIKDIKKTLRTDSTLFSLRGNYTGPNPFFFVPKRMELALRERRVDYQDTLSTSDTVFVYQLSAFVHADEKGLKEVKKEFEKVHRQNFRKFSQKEFEDLKTGDKVDGGLYNYFLNGFGLSPFSIAWARLENSDDYVLSIILRFKVIDNVAELAAPLHHP